MSDTIRQEHELSHWKEWQDQADAVWGWSTPAGRVRADRRARLFRELGRMGADSVVLEIGCGTGEFTRRVAPCVGHLTATDLSPELLERARKRLREANLAAKVTFAIQDAMKLTLAGSSFDAVFGCSILHHVDAEAALREMCRVLKPGGWCVFSEPNMMNPQIAVQKNIGFFKRRAGDSPDETAFFWWELRKFFERAGLDRVLVRHFDFLHPGTPPRWIPFVERWGERLEKCPGVRAISGSLICCARKPDGPKEESDD